jgi:hypothetical protein
MRLSPVFTLRFPPVSGRVRAYDELIRTRCAAVELFAEVSSLSNAELELKPEFRTD